MKPAQAPVAISIPIGVMMNSPAKIHGRKIQVSRWLKSRRR
jgi:hypothetical protein